MAATILKRKSSVEIDREICKDPKYIKADEELHKIVDKKLSKEKAQQFYELWGILIEAVIKAYFREGEKLGEKLEASLLIR